MIEGVQILSQSAVTGRPEGYMNATAILVIVMVFSLLLFFKIDARYNLAGTICALIVICSLSALVVLSVWDPQIETGRYRYEVIIDDSVSFSDIHEKYEVIKQRGDIWVLEDKE